MCRARYSVHTLRQKKSVGKNTSNTLPPIFRSLHLFSISLIHFALANTRTRAAVITRSLIEYKRYTFSWAKVLGRKSISKCCIMYIVSCVCFLYRFFHLAYFFPILDFNFSLSLSRACHIFSSFALEFRSFEIMAEKRHGHNVRTYVDSFRKFLFFDVFASHFNEG